MKILMLTPYLPYPLLSGGQIRSYNLLKNLHKDHEITLFSLIKHEDERKYIPHLEKLCTKVAVFKRSEQPFTLTNILQAGFSSYPFVVTRNLVSETKASIAKELSQADYDLIHVETFYMMPNIPATKIPTILVEQTIEYLGYQSYADSSRTWPIKPLLAIDIAKIRHWERHYWQHCDHLITMSEADKQYIHTLHPTIKNISVVANGVDTDFFDQTQKRLPESPTILIVGTFKWLPNVEAVQYLVKEIWPHITKKMPNAKLHIVGFSPSKQILKYGEDANITVSGNIEDIREAYAQAHVLLAPVLSGKGTRYKILEAMATNTPIVATKLAVEGISGVSYGKHVLVGETPQELAEKTCQVLQKPSLQEKLARAAKLLVSKNYNWQAISKDLDAIYQRMGRQHE